MSMSRILAGIVAIVFSTTVACGGEVRNRMEDRPGGAKPSESRSDSAEFPPPEVRFAPWRRQALEVLGEVINVFDTQGGNWECWELRVGTDIIADDASSGSSQPDFVIARSLEEADQAEIKTPGSTASCIERSVLAREGIWFFGVQFIGRQTIFVGAALAEVSNLHVPGDRPVPILARGRSVIAVGVGERNMSWTGEVLNCERLDKGSVRCEFY